MESYYFQSFGGEGGIRTHGTRKGSTVFETARFNHSRTSPRGLYPIYLIERGSARAASNEQAGCPAGNQVVADGLLRGSRPSQREEIFLLARLFASSQR